MNNCTVNNEELVNIDEVDEIPRSELHLLVAKVIADDNLQVVNELTPEPHPRKTVYSIVIKRLIDIILSLFAFLVTLPFNLIFGILTFFDVGRPIFYHETRIGKDGKPFQIYKFRNMTNETNVDGELLPAAQRVTKFGRIMRKYSLDELLNFWFILTGKMSFIGPRPLHKEYLDRYSNRHMARLAVRPGLECPTMDGKSFATTWSKQFDNDVDYVERISFAVDVKQVINLFKMVFNKKSNTIRSQAIRGGFMGYDIEGNSINSKQVPKRYVDEAIELYVRECRRCE